MFVVYIGITKFSLVNIFILFIYFFLSSVQYIYLQLFSASFIISNHFISIEKNFKFNLLVNLKILYATLYLIFRVKIAFKFLLFYPSSDNTQL